LGRAIGFAAGFTGGGLLTIAGIVVVTGAGRGEKGENGQGKVRQTHNRRESCKFVTTVRRLRSAAFAAGFLVVLIHAISVGVYAMWKSAANGRSVQLVFGVDVVLLAAPFAAPTGECAYAAG